MNTEHLNRVLAWLESFAGSLNVLEEESRFAREQGMFAIQQQVSTSSRNLYSESNAERQIPSAIAVLYLPLRCDVSKPRREQFSMDVLVMPGLFCSEGLGMSETEIARISYEHARDNRADSIPMAVFVVGHAVRDSESENAGIVLRVIGQSICETSVHSTSADVYYGESASGDQVIKGLGEWVSEGEKHSCVCRAFFHGAIRFLAKKHLGIGSDFDGCGRLGSAKWN